VDRALLVSSDPPGARVFVNGVDRGTTPARVSYVHEGRFEIRLEKPGYESVSAEVTTKTHLDAVPGPDFFAENLSPRKISRVTPVSYRLVPLKKESYTKEEIEALVARAKAFRDEARAAAAEPNTPRPTPPGQRSTTQVDPFPPAPTTR
jgi:PEGA domain